MKETSLEGPILQHVQRQLKRTKNHSGLRPKLSQDTNEDLSTWRLSYQNHREDPRGCPWTCKQGCSKDATNKNTCTATPATDPCSMMHKKHRRHLWKLRRNTHWQPQWQSIHPLPPKLRTLPIFPCFLKKVNYFYIPRTWLCRAHALQPGNPFYIRKSGLRGHSWWFAVYWLTSWVTSAALPPQNQSTGSLCYCNTGLFLGWHISLWQKGRWLPMTWGEASPYLYFVRKYYSSKTQ